MRRLIVNADDFGLTVGINRAVSELHAAGLLSGATLMACAPATADALRIAHATPSLAVGCHVVLVDGDPASLPREIPTLVDQKTGRFHNTSASFLQRLFAGRIHAAEIETEAAAQITSLQAQGITLTHIDTHKHVHMFPSVLRPVLRAGRAAEIRTVRNPFEPAWSRQATPTAPWLRRAELTLLRLLEPAFTRIVMEEGFSTTDGAIGVLATGTLDAKSIRSLLTGLPPGTWELVTHPGYNDADLAQAHTRLLGSRQIERDALQVLREFPAIQLISFADLKADSSPVAGNQ